jgi:hypothetical protein
MSTTHQLTSTGGATASLPLDTDGTLGADSDIRVPSQKAVKNYADAITAATAAQLGAVLNPSGLVFAPATVTESGVLPTASFVYLDSADAALAMTFEPVAGRLLVITQKDIGTEGHTCTLGPGTYDGTNEIATFNAPGETLVLMGLSGTRFAIILNLGSVALSHAA